MSPYTRRNLLAGIALAAHGAAKDQGPNYIDAHVHVWTPAVTTFLRPASASGPTYKPDSFTPEQLLAIARPSGVARIVLIQMSFYGTDNSYLLDAIKRYPDTFVGVGIVDHHSPDVRNEMIRLLSLKVNGYRILPGSDTAGWLDAPGMQVMWQCGAEKRIAMCPLIDPNAIASVDRMCGKFPDTPVVIDHMARIGADGIIRETDIRPLCGLARLQKHSRESIRVLRVRKEALSLYGSDSVNSGSL